YFLQNGNFISSKWSKFIFQKTEKCNQRRNIFIFFKMGKFIFQKTKMYSETKGVISLVSSKWASLFSKRRKCILKPKGVTFIFFKMGKFIFRKMEKCILKPKGVQV